MLGPVEREKTISGDFSWMFMGFKHVQAVLDAVFCFFWSIFFGLKHYQQRVFFFLLFFLPGSIGARRYELEGLELGMCSHLESSTSHLQQCTCTLQSDGESKQGCLRH